MELQEFVYKLKEKIDQEIGWLGGARNKDPEILGMKKAYTMVNKCINELSEFHQPNVISSVCKHTEGSCKIIDKKHVMKCDYCGEIIWQADLA